MTDRTDLAAQLRWRAARAGVLANDGAPVLYGDADAALDRAAANALSAPVTERRGIYTASKTKHAEKWRRLRATGLPVISTWIDEAGEGESADLADLWIRCVREASTCQVLILYREPADILKGAWIEMGSALAVGIPVLAVGIREFTIAHHPGVEHFDGIVSAVARARAILTAALGADAGTTTIRPPEPTGPGPETYPGHDPAAGLPGAGGAADVIKTGEIAAEIAAWMEPLGESPPAWARQLLDAVRGWSSMTVAGVLIRLRAEEARKVEEK